MNPGKWCPRDANEITAKDTCSGVNQNLRRISTTGTISTGEPTRYTRSHQGATIQTDEGRVAVFVETVDTALLVKMRLSTEKTLRLKYCT